MPAANANCQTCHGAGDPNGCPDCHGTTPAQPPQRQQGQAVTKGRRKWPWVVGILAALGLLGTGGYFLFRNSPSSATTEAMNGKQPAPANSSSNLDPTKPAQTAVAQKDPECPDGSLWDTKKKVCVQPAVVPPFPSAITVNIPCPSNCAPAAPPPTTTASASAPAPKPPGTSPVVPVKADAVFDLTKVGNPAVFPSGT